MNRLLQFFFATFILGIVILASLWVLQILPVDTLKDWGTKGAILWVILGVGAILIVGIMKNNSLRQVIEWKDISGSESVLFWRWDGNLRDEIKNKSKLIIAPEQGAILVKSGKITDILDEEGLYTLDSKNIPFITNLVKLMQENESEHKVQIFFYKKTEIANLAWGTAQPIVYQDETYGFPLRFGMFGNSSVAFRDVRVFFTHYLQNQAIYTRADLEELLRSRMVSRLAHIVPSLGYSYLDLDKHRAELCENILASLREDIDTLGITIKDFRIDGLSFDAETRKYIDTVAGASAKKKASEQADISYTEYEKLGALRDAAQNESGAAGVIAGINAGNLSSGIAHEDTSSRK